VRGCATVIAAGVIGCGDERVHRAWDEGRSEGVIERVVHVQVEAQGSGLGGADVITGQASFIPVARLPEAWRPPDGTCALVPPATDERGIRGGLGVLLDFGVPLELVWDARRHQFLGDQSVSGRDVAWQPVSVASSGNGVWAFESRRAVQFGETPMAWIAERRPSGEVVIRWHGTYGRDDLSVRVVGEGAQIECAPGADQVVIPWWALTLADARIEFAATRRQHVLTDSGTLLVGEATIVVPVKESASEVLETLSAEQPQPWEEAPSHSFGPNRIRRGTRPGSVRSTPS
jgi:hypothetical protein